MQATSRSREPSKGTSTSSRTWRPTTGADRISRRFNDWHWIGALAALAATVGLAVLHNGTVAGVAAILGAGLLAWAMLPTDQGILGPVYAALGLRTGLAVVDVYLLPLPDSTGDAVRFLDHGGRLASQPWGAIAGYASDGAEAFDALLAAVFKVFGVSGFLGASLNVVAGTALVVVVWRTADKLWGGRTGVHAAWAVALFPSLALYSVVLLRSSIVILLLATTALLLVDWWNGGGAGKLVLGTVSILLAGYLHPGLVPLVVVPWLLAVVKAWPRAGAQRTPPGVPLLGVAIGVPLAAALLTSSGWAPSKLGQFLHAGGLSELFDTVIAYQDVAARGRAAYPGWLVPDSPWGLLWTVPVRPLYFLFAPFPWMVTALRDLMGLLDASLFLGAFWLVYRGHRTRRGLGTAAPAILLLVLGVFVFSLGVSNYGTGLRHRAKFLPLILMLIPSWPFTRTILNRGESR